MENKYNTVAGLNSAPRVMSSTESELQGLQGATEQLSDTVNALYARLTSALRQPNPETGRDGKDQVELAPLPQSIRVQKEGVLRNVYAIRDLLDRLEL